MLQLCKCGIAQRDCTLPCTTSHHVRKALHPPYPVGLAFDGTSLFVADSSLQVIRRLAPSHVAQSPVIQSVPANQTVLAASELTFTVGYFGAPAPKLAVVLYPDSVLPLDDAAQRFASAVARIDAQNGPAVVVPGVNRST